ncbi:MAG TPA: hypothetical protein VFT30_03010 [Nitrospira sp.]|nr:hypothetical protein [Nitrospira sp.]
MPSLIEFPKFLRDPGEELVWSWKITGRDPYTISFGPEEVAPEVTVVSTDWGSEEPYMTLWKAGPQLEMSMVSWPMVDLPHRVRAMFAMEFTCARGEMHEGDCVPTNITLGEE